MIYFTASSQPNEYSECGRCGTKIKGPTASICEVCQESLWVTGVRVFGGGAGGGSGNKDAKGAGNDNTNVAS